MTRVGVGLVLAFCLVGCASAPPEQAYYLLRVEPPPELRSADPLPIGLGRISLPPYLDRAGLVVQTDEHSVREARYHLWAEPLDEGAWFYLRDRISSELGRALHPGPDLGNSVRYSVDIRINEFHGTLDGRARLVARWSVRDLEQGLRRRESTLLAGEASGGRRVSRSGEHRDRAPRRAGRNHRPNAANTRHRLVLLPRSAAERTDQARDEDRDVHDARDRLEDRQGRAQRASPARCRRSPTSSA